MIIDSRCGPTTVNDNNDVDVACPSLSITENYPGVSSTSVASNALGTMALQDVSKQAPFSHKALSGLEVSPERKKMAIQTSIQRSQRMWNACHRCFGFKQLYCLPARYTMSGTIDVLRIPATSYQGSWLGTRFCDIRLTRSTDSRFHCPCDVSKAVLGSDRVEDAIYRTLSERDVDKPNARLIRRERKRARNIFRIMRAAISTAFVKLTGWVLMKVLGRMLDSIEIDPAQLMLLKERTSDGTPVIYIPQHRSHLDYTLLTFIIWHYDIQIPYVAAGDNLNIPVFSSFERMLGGFFIRRTLDPIPGKRDYIYRAVLNSYINSLLTHGQSLEFFMEGGRSRNGKALLPKAGIFSIVSAAVFEGIVDNCYIVPVSITYERLLEGSFANELLGKPKVKETFWHALKSFVRFVQRSYGSVFVNFAQPILLKDYFEALKSPDGVDSQSAGGTKSGPVSGCSVSLGGAQRPTGGATSSSLSSLSMFRLGSVGSLDASSPVLSSFSLCGLGEDRFPIAAVCFHLSYELDQHRALSCTNLLSFLLLNKYRMKGTTLLQLESSFEAMTVELQRRSFKVLGSEKPVRSQVMKALMFLGEKSVAIDSTRLPSFDNGNGQFPNNIQDNDIIRPSLTLPDVFDLAYYSNGILPVLLLEAVVGRSAVALAAQHDECSCGCLGSFGRQELLNKCLLLCDILQYEFVFCPPCSPLENSLEETIDKLLEKKLLAKCDPGSCSSGSRRSMVSLASSEFDHNDSDDELLPFKNLCLVAPDAQNSSSDLLDIYCLSRILSPFLESYIVASSCLPDLDQSNCVIEEDKFRRIVQQRCLEHAQKATSDGDNNNNNNRQHFRFPESVSLENIRNAIRLFKKHGVLISGPQPPTARDAAGSLVSTAPTNLIALNEQYKIDYYLLDEYIISFEEFRECGRGSPGRDAGKWSSVGFKL